MIKKKIPFQIKYIEKLSKNSIEFLEDRYPKIIVFQAPTGSGKTIMVADSLSKITKAVSDKQSLSFLWISVNSLHEQSKNSLEEFLNDERLIDCINIDELTDNEIQENQILFINWEKIIKKDNLFMQENDFDWNLETVIANTKEDGREIILIIDESHRTAKSEKSKEIINIIQPKLTIEVSATPKEGFSSDLKITVPLEEVIKDGLIKSEVRINPNVAKAKSNEDFLIEALKKRKYLKDCYNKMGININPLLLIQIPNKKQTDSRPPEDYMIELLKKHNYTVSSGKLAIWLSDKDKKINLTLLEKNNNEVDVLIFKEAIALGWDCPRAAILLLQREWNVDRYEFNIQTLGRIMRMPEQKHYTEQIELNYGYVYSASLNFEIVQELAEDYASVIQMNINNEIYNPLHLTSEFVRRKRELTRLSGEFKKCLYDAAEELKIKDKINIHKVQLSKSVGVDGIIIDIDHSQVVDFHNKATIIKEREEISKFYSDFCASRTAPFARSRSTEIIKSSIRYLFKIYYDISNEDFISSIVMNQANNSEFSQLVEKAKENYKQLPTKTDEIIINKDWEVPESVSIFSNYVKIDNAKKSILQPFYLKKDKNNKVEWSKPEQAFIEELEKTDDDVKWWYKNSKGESKYFGIAYKKTDGFYYNFYPDFIIKTKKELLIVEIKDNTDFKSIDNLLKLNAGKSYLKKYNLNQSIYFNIISPSDYFNFFKYLKDQDIKKFVSSFENNLIIYSRSQQVLLTDKIGKTKDDEEKLELYKELDKALDEISENKFKVQMLEMDLKIAEDNIVELSKIVSDGRPIIEYGKEVKINIPKPFNICVLGEVTNETEIYKELNKLFSKYGFDANQWDIEFFNNNKIRNTDIFAKLKKGQSKFNLIITGQIHHHSSKGNKKSNILSELKDKKYIESITGCDPKEILTAKELKRVINDFIISY